MKKIKVGPGEYFVTHKNNEMIITVLGSCVAACIRDPVAGVGGMNHFMLPESQTGNWGGASANMRYGNFAMEQLVNDILRRGGQRSRLEIKVFGGARMIANGAAVGPQNADFVEAYLKAENMPIAAQHLRGRHARRIEYDPLKGGVRLLELGIDDAQVNAAECRFLDVIRKPRDTGSVELFE
jgi:chemotaxis protein CheD